MRSTNIREFKPLFTFSFQLVYFIAKPGQFRIINLQYLTFSVFTSLYRFFINKCCLLQYSKNFYNMRSRNLILTSFSCFRRNLHEF